jgi:hypothetical protein
VNQRSALSVDDAAARSIDAELTVPRSRRSFALSAAVAGLFVSAFLLRVIDLNSAPGFNADEAWYGVQIQRLQASLPVVVRAPSGRVSSDVFLALVLAPLQAVTGPAIWVLRVPAVIAGLATIWLAFSGLRRPWGRTTAVSTALVLAALPVTVAYSRFGWDPSLLGPFLVAVLIFAGRGKWPAASVALAAAIVVHPTAIFVLPLLWGLLLGVARDQARRPDPAPVVRWWAFVLASGGLVVLSQLLGGPRQSVGLSVVLGRLTDVEQAWNFTTGLFSVFSGRAVHTYLVSAADPAVGWLVLERMALLTTLVVMVVGLIGAIRRRRGRDVGLLVGTAASLGLLYLTSGASGVTPEQSRYALFSVPAVVLSFVVALGHTAFLVRRLTGRFAWVSRAAIASMLALSVGLLAESAFGYLQPLREHGSTTYEAFLTAPVDPKQQVWQIVSAGSDASPAIVYCADWWVCYPLEYFSSAGGDGVAVKAAEVADLPLPPTGGSADFAVVRTGSVDAWVLAQRLRERARSDDGPGPWFVVDGQGRPAYTVFQL